MHVLSAFFIGFLVGGLIEYAVAFAFDFFEKKPLKINHRFTLGKRISLAALPLWGFLALLITGVNSSYISLFIFSAIVGTILEGLLGRFFRKFFGVKIWTYKYGSIGNFTSLYSLPYWGAAGLIFAYLGKFLGL